MQYLFSKIKQKQKVLKDRKEEWYADHPEGVEWLLDNVQHVLNENKVSLKDSNFFHNLKFIPREENPCIS